MYRRVLAKSCVFAAVSCAAVIMVFPISGCGDSTRGRTAGTDVSDARKVRGIASSVNVGPAAWESAFAEGAAPTGAKQDLYLDRVFSVKEVKVDGDSATVDITVKDATDFKEIGQTQWTLKKGANMSWKITDAPVPDGN